VTLKTLATGVAALAIVGAAAAGVISVAPGAAVATTAAVRPVVFDVPIPLDPPADMPTADDLSGVLYGLADPSVSFRNKGNLIQGGLGIIEGTTADHLLSNAGNKGYLPLTFQVANILPAGPGAATATVTASGPSLPPRTQTITFVDDNGWKLSRGSATTVLNTFSS
jgi:hypothetical protein